MFHINGKIYIEWHRMLSPLTDISILVEATHHIQFPCSRQSVDKGSKFKPCIDFTQPILWFNYFFPTSHNVESGTKVQIVQDDTNNESIGRRQVFSDSAASQQPHRNRLSVGSSLDIPGGSLHPLSDDVFKERPRSCSHNPSLSRSPAVKRRNDHSAIRIAGLATLGTRKFAKSLSISSSSSLPQRDNAGNNVDGGVEQKQGIKYFCVKVIFVIRRDQFNLLFYERPVFARKKL